MRCPLIVAIHLDFFRHSLFSYENTYANGESLLQLLSRNNPPDSNGRFHRRPYAPVVDALQEKLFKPGAGYFIRPLSPLDEAIQDPRPSGFTLR